MASPTEPLIACWVFVLPDDSGKGGARAGSGAARLWRRTALTPHVAHSIRGTLGRLVAGFAATSGVAAGLRSG
jgi:hypothetical protein